MMRVTIAGHSFYLQASEVERAMTGIKAEPATGESVRVGRRWFPVKQVGAVISRQDRRDFSAAEVSIALRRLGFTTRSAPPAPEPVLSLPEPAPLAASLPEPAPEHAAVMSDPAEAPDSSSWPTSLPPLPAPTVSPFGTAVQPTTGT